MMCHCLEKKTIAKSDDIEMKVCKICGIIEFNDAPCEMDLIEEACNAWNMGDVKTQT